MKRSGSTRISQPLTTVAALSRSGSRGAIADSPARWRSNRITLRLHLSRRSMTQADLDQRSPIRTSAPHRLPDYQIARTSRALNPVSMSLLLSRALYVLTFAIERVRFPPTDISYAANSIRCSSTMIARWRILTAPQRSIPRTARSIGRAVEHFEQQAIRGRDCGLFAPSSSSRPELPMLHRMRGYAHWQRTITSARSPTRPAIRRAAPELATTASAPSSMSGSARTTRRSPTTGKRWRSIRTTTRAALSPALAARRPESAQLPPGPCSGEPETTSHQDRIKGCTEVIDSGSLNGWTLKTAYCNRGYALTELGEYDRVIADSDALLRSTRMLACAYLNRGRAWYYKNDLDRAIADYNAGDQARRRLSSKPSRAAVRPITTASSSTCGRRLRHGPIAIEPDARTCRRGARTRVRMKGEYQRRHRRPDACDRARARPRRRCYRQRGDALRRDAASSIAPSRTSPRRLELKPGESSLSCTRAPSIHDLKGDENLGAADQAGSRKTRVQPLPRHARVSRLPRH